MTTPDHDADDPLAHRAGALLRGLPVDPSAVARVRRRLDRAPLGGAPRPAVWLATGALAASALFAAGITLFDGHRPGTPAPLPADGTAPHPIAFSHVAADADRVALVGEFNGWNPDATPMARWQGGTTWTASVALPPGRHLYAFVVNGTRIETDPVAPRTPADAYGGHTSVLVVGSR